MESLDEEASASRKSFRYKPADIRRAAATGNWQLLVYIFLASHNLYPPPPDDSGGEGEEETKEAAKEDSWCWEDPHKPDTRSMTPLHYAVIKNSYECTKFLLVNGAKTDIPNADGLTPLHLALENMKILTLLLQYSRDIDTLDWTTGETALARALRLRLPMASKLLIAHKDHQNQMAIDESSAEDKTVICIACRHHNENAENANTTACPEQYSSFSNFHDSINHIRRIFERGCTSCLKCLLDNMTEQVLCINKTNLCNLLLKEAINHIEDLENFKQVVRLLYVNGAATFRSKVSTRELGQHLIPFDNESPLTKAIKHGKFDKAEFLIREGLLVKELCIEAVFYMLRSYPIPKTKRILKLLYLYGYMHIPGHEGLFLFCPEWKTPLKLEVVIFNKLREMAAVKCDQLKSRTELQEYEARMSQESLLDQLISKLGLNLFAAKLNQLADF